jgi:carbon-monoxide dehydrogenase medium subunit
VLTRHRDTASSVLHRPVTVAEAVDLLADGSASVLAGGSWVMRGEIRGDGFADAYVLVSGLPELLELRRTDDALVIGAAVTHAQLARFLAGDPHLAGLSAAARTSANPAIRRVATVGGNLATIDFAAADLVPALLALSARVTLVDAAGERHLALADYLASRPDAAPGALLTQVTVPVTPGLTVHERLTMRVAGDYPVAIVDAHVRLDADGLVDEATIAVGSVEPVARLWPSLSSRLVGAPLDAGVAEATARELAGELRGRDGVEAQGWYRLQVLPTLVGRAFYTLQQETGQQ